MFFKWLLFLLLCVLLADGRGNFPWAESEIKKFVKENLEEFKVRFQLKWEQLSTNYPLLEKRQSSKSGRHVKNCIEVLEGHLADIQRKIEVMSSKVKNVWLAPNTKKTTFLKVNGRIFSGEGNSITKLNLDYKSKAPSPATLRDIIQKTGNKIKLLRKKFEMTLSKTGRQSIRSKFIVLKNVTVDRCKIDELNNHVTLNRLRTSRVTSALKRRGNQLIQNRMSFSNLSCMKSNIGVINKNKIEDFVLLSPGSQTLTGNYMFLNVSASNIFVKGTINEERVDNFILSSKEQTIQDVKEFRRISAVNLGAKSLGEVSIAALRKVKEESLLQPLALDFSSKLIVQGNLNVLFLNDKDIKQLFLNTVKTNGKQTITGEKRFRSPVIKGNVDSFGKINNHLLDQFLTTNTNQTIYVSVEFQNPVAFQNILTNSVNGIDLSQQAVIRSRNLVVRGRKSFTKNLKISSISLKEGIRIDSFDPSVEVFHIVKKNDAEAWRIFPFHQVKIRNINATDVEVEVDYFPQLEKLNNVWLRSSEQYIVSTVQMKYMHVKEELEVSRVNNLTVDDLVPVKGNAAIRAPVHFAKKVSTKTLNLGAKSKVNISPEYWNQQKVKISSNITIENAELKGNLNVVGYLRNFEPGFMHVKDNQVINGFVQFENIKAQDLRFKQLNFSVINRINITDFLDHAVVAPIVNKSISNKHFKNLNGSAMTWSEVLNKVPTEKIVLKNKNQSKLSPWTFVKAPSFKKVLVKNFFDDIQIENIIYTDEVGIIANKQFNGNISSTYLYTSGLVNGINVSSLHQEAFNKSRKNTLKRKLTVQGQVTAKEIQVAANKIDNIDLEEVILLDASQEIQRLIASNVKAQNITVAGRINGCDLLSVVKNTFTLQESKNITAHTVAKSLIIEGNVKIKYLMKEKFSDQISFLKMASSSEIERDLEFENISANSIQFLQLLNNIKVDFLLTDSVMRNKDQNITSWKMFQEISATRPFIRVLNSSKIDGMSSNEIFDLYINKTENRSVVLMIPSIKNLVARQVIVTGSLNGLKLPNDVVLSDTNEVIKSTVVINSTANASLGVIIHGKINEIDLENFLMRRVTLNSVQDIFSVLHFEEDVKLQGNTVVNGSINTIKLENALKNRPNQTVFDQKSFTNTLKISADITVNGFVNGVKLEEFVWSSKNETIKEVQFSKLNATDIVCSTINGVDVSDLYNYTHVIVHNVYDKLYNLTSDILSLQDSLRSQKDTAENPLSFFGYFELQEVVKFGPVLKFLPVYEYGIIGEKYELQVTQMVMWVSRKVNGCKKIMSFVTDFSDGDTFNVTKKIRGKVFPFSLQIEKEEELVGFYVQAEDERKCSTTIKSLLIKAVYSSGDVSNSRISLPDGADLIDVQLMELHDIFLMVASNFKDPGERIFIYHYDTSNNSWSQHQEFYEQNLTSVEFILVERDEMSLYDPPDVYLSVTGDKKNPGVMVYEWDFDIEEFYLKTNLSTSVSTHALWLYAHRNLYLLLAKEKIEVTRNHTKVAVYNEPLEVYVLDEDELVLNHIVNIKGICFIESFTLGGEIFLIATSSHLEVVYILQFRGYNGFQVIQEIQAAGVTEARIYTIDSQLYLAINSRTIQSRILKASIHDGSLFVS